MAINPVNFTQGPARTLVEPAEAASLRRAGVLVDDPRRERPRYFDGRFLAARDLIRDQQYFLTREADLGRAAGSGVANGLFVAPTGSAHELRVAAGQGVTPAGELVLLPEAITINLADVPQAEQLSARFGLSRQPAPPMRSRTGLFVLALRPVEFTANPIGAYPTTLTGPRTVEDGDVIEATAIVLVPWQDDGAADALEERRGRAAHAIFVADATSGGRARLSANVLPLAMLALQNNTIVWIDEALVRRELGADRGDLPGLGFSPRALRLAHLMQHQEHLADVVARLRSQPFAASTQFPALPPAGPLPPNVIDVRDFSQRYFPAEVDVDFSIIPDDELPALVEESLALPPIDFSASAAALDLTAVMILAPIPRDEFRAVLARLQSRRRLLRAAAANLVAQRKPLEILRGLRLPMPLAPVDAGNPVEAEWARLAQLPTLWFVRRRNLAYRDDLAGAPVLVGKVDEAAREEAVLERIKRIGLGEELAAVRKQATAEAQPRVLRMLAAARFVDSQVLTAAALGALSGAARKALADGPLTDHVPPGRLGTAGLLMGNLEAIRPLPLDSRRAVLDEAAVLAVAGEMAVFNAGAGLLRLERASPSGLAAGALRRIAADDSWRELDAEAVGADEAKLAKLLLPLLAQPRGLPRGAPGGAADATKRAAPSATSASSTAVPPSAAGSAPRAVGQKASKKVAKPPAKRVRSTPGRA